jgi:hypothetical protein
MFSSFFFYSNIKEKAFKATLDPIFLNKNAIITTVLYRL